MAIILPRPRNHPGTPFNHPELGQAAAKRRLKLRKSPTNRWESDDACPLQSVPLPRPRVAMPYLYGRCNDVLLPGAVRTSITEHPWERGGVMDEVLSMKFPTQYGGGSLWTIFTPLWCTLNLTWTATNRETSERPTKVHYFYTTAANWNRQRNANCMQFTRFMLNKFETPARRWVCSHISEPLASPDMLGTKTLSALR